MQQDLQAPRRLLQLFCQYLVQLKVGAVCAFFPNLKYIFELSLSRLATRCAAGPRGPGRVRLPADQPVLRQRAAHAAAHRRLRSGISVREHPLADVRHRRDPRGADRAAAIAAADAPTLSEWMIVMLGALLVAAACLRLR